MWKETRDRTRWIKRDKVSLCAGDRGKRWGGGGGLYTGNKVWSSASSLFKWRFCSRCRRCCLNLPPSRELKQQRRQRQRKRLLKSELALFQRTAGDTAHACALLPVSLQSVVPRGRDPFGQWRDRKRGLWERDWSLCQHGGPRMARDSVAYWDKVTLVKRTRRAHYNQSLLVETPA